MSDPGTWRYGTVLTHEPSAAVGVPTIITDTRVMFVRWAGLSVRERVPVLLFLRDGMAPVKGLSMVGHVAATRIHPKDWRVIA